MKIDLYTNEKIFTFTLPNMMQGIYKFDMDKEQPYKLINIEARDNNWVLYSTPYVNVLEGNAPILETVISPGKYYFLKREDKIYLIRVSNLYDDSIKYFASKVEDVYRIAIKNYHRNLIPMFDKIKSMFGGRNK